MSAKKKRGQGKRHRPAQNIENQMERPCVAGLFDRQWNNGHEIGGKRARDDARHRE